MKSVDFLFGCAIPTIISLVAFSFFVLIDLDQDRMFYFSLNNLSLPLFENLLNYSEFRFLGLCVFSINVLLVPIMFIYWWRIIPNHYRGNLRRPGFKFTSYFLLSCIFLISIIVSSWFISPEDLTGRRGLLVASYQYFFLFYIFFIFPISVVSWISTGAAKFCYLKLMIIRSNHG